MDGPVDPTSFLCRGSAHFTSSLLLHFMSFTQTTIISLAGGSNKLASSRHRMTPLPQALSEVQGALQSTYRSVVNSAAQVSVSLRMSISHASHAELYVVPNCIMFSLTHGLSFDHNRYPCCPFCLLFLHLDVSAGPFLSLSGHHQFLPSLSAYAVPLFKRWSLLMPLL